jgi:hypothetical protein
MQPGEGAGLAAPAPGKCEGNAGGRARQTEREPRYVSRSGHEGIEL